MKESHRHEVTRRGPGGRLAALAARLWRRGRLEPPVPDADANRDTVADADRDPYLDALPDADRNAVALAYADGYAHGYAHGWADAHTHALR